MHPFPEGSRQPSHSLVIMCISLGSTVIFPKSETAMLSKLNLNQPLVHEEEDQVISDEKGSVRRKLIYFLSDDLALTGAKDPSQ